MSGFRTERERMVTQQIHARGIHEPRLLAVMREVPRHRFVPPRLAAEAYEDRPVAIGKGQTISQPYMVALMTQVLQATPDHRILEVGTGSGYQTAVLAGLARHVDSIERIPELARNARQVLADLGITNVAVHVGDGTCGFPEAAPFDGILVTAGSPGIPDPLVAQLREGGRLVIPVGDACYQTLTVLVRDADGVRERSVTGCVFVPLIGAHGWPHPTAAQQRPFNEDET